MKSFGWGMSLGLFLSVMNPVWAGSWQEQADGTWAYEDSYQQGYKDGTTYQRPFALEPLPPLTPLPRLGEDARDSYLRGALDGLNRRRQR
jgi:hypothetical protein